MNTTSNDFINHYSILGVPKDATNKELRSAYKNLCLIYHPDKPSGDPLMFEQINDSYAVLKDIVLRQQYDLSLEKKHDMVDFDNLRNEFHTFIKTPDIFSNGFVTMPKPIIVGLKEDKIKDEDLVLDDLNLIREQDDLENLPDKIFENDEDFDINKFNENFNTVIENICNDDVNEEDTSYVNPLPSKSNGTNLNEIPDYNGLGPQENLNNNHIAFNNMFSINKNLKPSRNTNDNINDDYFKKMLEDRNNIYDTIEYSNVIVDGVDYKAIGFM